MYHFTIVALYLLGGVIASPLSRQRICWKNEQRILTTTACFKTFIVVLLFSIKWLRQPVFNCESSLLLVTSFKLFNHLEVSTLSPTCLYMIDQFKYFKFILYVWQYRGTQQEILRKRPENNNSAWIKLSEAILGDFWEKFICSSLLARLVEEFPASKVHLRPATWRTGKFPSRRMSRHYWLVWVWS